MTHPLSQTIFQRHGANLAWPMGAQWLAKLPLHCSASVYNFLVGLEEWQLPARAYLSLFESSVYPRPEAEVFHVSAKPELTKTEGHIRKVLSQQILKLSNIQTALALDSRLIFVYL
jgi:hypothetical protein